MEFNLNQTQLSIIDSVNNIMKNYNDEYWLQCDKESQFPQKFYEEVANGGWLGICMPKEYGGSALGVSEASIFMQKISETGGGMAAASSIHINIFGPHPIVVYGTKEQKDKWLKPLLDGSMRSAFAMTEPNVASSDATNISSTIVADGDEYVINGEKWWTSGYGRPDCGFMIFMGVSNPDAPKHQRQSQIIVPRETKGIELKRMLTVYGADHAPSGHAHLIFKNVRVPKENMILGEGRGFEIAQGRLGPGRIHHCMKIIGAAETALKLLCERASTRVAFGKAIAELGGNYDVIAKCRIEIEMCRLLTLKAAYMMDILGNKKAKSEIAQPKVEVPSMAVRIIERAVQIHGGAGVSQDTPLASLYSSIRYLRIGDGPDEVHLRTIAKEELSKYEEL